MYMYIYSKGKTCKNEFLLFKKRNLVKSTILHVSVYCSIVHVNKLPFNDIFLMRAGFTHLITSLLYTHEGLPVGTEAPA